MLVCVNCWRLGTALVILYALCSAGCSKPGSSSVPATSVPAKPQVIALTLEGHAERTSKRQILVTLRDTSGDGAKVIDVNSVGLDRLTDKDGQAVPALLQSFNWSKKATEKKGADGGQEVFQLQLIIDTRFAQPVANLEGSFRTYAGNITSLDFPVKDLRNGQVTDTRLQALSITAKVAESFRVELELDGADTTQIANVELVSGSEVLKQVGRGSSSSGSKPSNSRAYWRWVSEVEPSKDAQLKVWLKSDDSQGDPSWVLKPFGLPDATVRHESLGIVGQIRTQRALNAQIKGPPQKLLSAKFVDGDITPQQGEPNVSVTYDRTITLSMTAPTPTTALQISVSEDGFENMQVFQIENMAIEKAR